MKKICLAALIVLSSAIAGGCAAGNPKPSEAAEAAFEEPLYDWVKGSGDTLTLWAQEPDSQRSYMTKAIKRYCDLTGNQVRVVELPQDQFTSKTAQALSSQKDAPDLILSYGGSNIDSFDPDGNFYDFSEAAWVDDLTSTSINQTVYHGKIIGLPLWEASISGTIYNKKIFHKYSLDVPKTQKEFLDTCQILSDNGITPLYLPAAEISMLLYQLPLDSIVEDSETLNALNDGSIGYADLPGMQTIVEWYRDMAQREYLGENYQSNDWNGMNEAMSSGKYAMMLCWDTWLYTDYTGDPKDFGLMPAFAGVPEGGTFEGPNLGLLIVNRHSPHAAEALNFITFMADPYNYNTAFEGIYTAPVFKQQISSISTPQYMESERLIEHNYRDSTAWLRIRGFSQMDASCILDYMEAPESVTALECLRQMDSLRNERLQADKKK